MFNISELILILPLRQFIKHTNYYIIKYSCVLYCTYHQSYAYNTYLSVSFVKLFIL